MALPDTCVASGADRSPNEWPVFVVPQNADSSFSTSLVDRDGVALAIGDTETVTLVLAEMPGDEDAYIEQACTITDADTGTVSVAFDASAVEYPGVWAAEFIIKDAAGVAQHRAKCFVEVEGSLLDETGFSNRPLTIAEVRLWLRDKSSVDNYLLESVQFTDTEIAFCIRRPIDEWNETPPPIGRYTPATFPYRYHWMYGVAAELYAIAAQHAERNKLNYSAAGVSVQDNAKGAEYGNMAGAFRREWLAWMARQKRARNMAAWFGSTHQRVYGQTDTIPGVS